MKIILLLLLVSGCSAYHKCIDGKYYWCPENEESDCRLAYETVAKIKPETCVKRGAK